MSDFSSRLDDVGRSTDEPTLRLGRLPAPKHESSVASLISNLKDFLSERPVKLRPGQETAFRMPVFGAGLGENLKEFFRPSAKGRVNSDLLVDWKESGGFLDRVRDALFPKKLPPLQVTSQPVTVKDIWTKDTQFTRVQALSVTIHVAVLVAIIVPSLTVIMSPAITKANSSVEITTISPYLPKLAPGVKKAGGGGGGGEHNPVPASKGRAPKFDYTQMASPSVHPPAAPKFAVRPTLAGPPQLNVPSPNMNNWGDPLAKVLTDSNGPGSGGGIGTGSGGGIGSGSGGGLGPGSGGGTGGGVYNAGTGGYGYPACLYCPQAQYSDEAVKAKYQGTVELIAIITADGRATDIHVMRTVGLGLDEKAIEAVRSWRFKPALGPDGKPAPVRQIIEVTFHLY